MSTSPADCRTTLLTPAGRAAIASIAVEGPDAIRVVEQFFSPLGRRKLAAIADREILVGHWRTPNSPPEEVVVGRLTTARVEIHCHGGLAASEAIYGSLLAAGASPQQPREWLASQKLDRIGQEAWLALTAARTTRVAAILLDQFRGALRETLAEIRQLLLRREAAAAVVRIDRLLQLAPLGLHLTRPWRVALAGRPNVGKSSLVNALLGYERSIVFDEPGTTRDVLTASTAFDGWAVELADTAGYREALDPLEQEGTRRAQQTWSAADLTVLVVSAAELYDPAEVELLQQGVQQSLLVGSKADLAAQNTRLPTDVLLTSAVTGAGIRELSAAVVAKLIPELPRAGEAVPFHERHRAGLVACRHEIQTGHLAAAIDHLDELVA